MKILHRDLKSANVFLTKSGIAKLGDMNKFKVIRKEAICETQTGTPYYASLQVWNDQPYYSKSEICLKPPFRARDMEGLYKKVTRGYFSRINKNFSNYLMGLLKKLIKVDPEQRLNANEIIELSLVKKHTKKNKQFEVDEKSVLLKTIKLTKNINYLTERLPKPNYSPLRLKSINPTKRVLSQRQMSKSPYDLHLSLSPIQSQNKSTVKQKQLSKDRKVSQILINSSRRNLIKSERNSQRKIQKYLSLPKLVIKKEKNFKIY